MKEDTNASTILPVIYEYLLIINPSSAVSDYIRGCKNDLSGMIGNYDAYSSWPHITLITFLNTSRIDPLLRTLNGIADLTPIMDISLKDFGQFSRKTIFARVKGNDNLQLLFRMANSAVRHYNPLGFIARHYFTPHVTVSKGLSAEQYAIALTHFRALQYEASFSANDMKLLRRRYNLQTQRGEGKCDLIEAFHFNPSVKGLVSQEQLSMF